MLDGKKKKRVPDGFVGLFGKGKKKESPGSFLRGEKKLLEGGKEGRGRLLPLLPRLPDWIWRKKAGA